MLRINAHAFVSEVKTAEAIRAAFSDRRLNRAALRLFQGGVPEATALYGRETSPPLIIIELRDAKAAPALLDGLAEVCDAGTQVIALGADNDVDIYRTLLRRGVTDYLVTPLEPARLIEALEAMFQSPDKAPKGRVIAFLGTRGGSGSSTVAHNTAVALGELTEEEVVVVDLDLPFGSVDLGFNRDAPQGVRHAIADPGRLDEQLLQRFLIGYGDRVKILAAPPSLDGDGALQSGALEQLIDVVRHSSPFVILDVPHVWSEWVRYSLTLCDDVVLTAMPDLVSLRNGRNLIDWISQKRRNDRPPFLVVNHLGAYKKADISMKDFGNAVGLAPTLALDSDPVLFGSAATGGQTVMEIGRKSKAADGFRKLAGLISGREAKVAAKKPAFTLFKPKPKKAAGER